MNRLDHVFTRISGNLLYSFFLSFALTTSVCIASDFEEPSAYSGTDSQRIQQAVDAASKSGKRVVIPRHNTATNRALWLLDEAILLPSGVTVELDGCRLKLSDRCRDNFFRSANCGVGITDVKPLQNIHIIGRNGATLEGADRPRATGDGAKTLGERTFGTDAGVAGESQKGDWRNIGILLAKTAHFSIQGIHMIDSHCWGISIEYSSDGILRDLSFDSVGLKKIDGKDQKILNQDGVDLRRGCHDILVENISGRSGDDLVALTAISGEGKTAGALEYTMATGDEKTEYPGIHHVIIRNVRGYCPAGHHIVRLLNTGGLPMENILIDGIVDTSPAGVLDKAALKIGDKHPAYGGINTLGTTRRIIATNVITQAKFAVLVEGSLVDSFIGNVLQSEENRKAGQPAVVITAAPEIVKDVTVYNAR